MPAFLPAVTFPVPNVATGGVAPREVFTAAAQAAQPGRQQKIALTPAGTPARIVLGRRPVGGDIDNALVHGSYFVMRVIWCWAPGGIDAVESVTWNDEALPVGVTITTYTGAAGQGIDPTLEAAWLAAGETYTDTLPDLSYSVLKCPNDLVSNGGLPNLVAMVRGVKAYDPRTLTTVWTQNPSLLTAAWLTATAWGPGMTVNDAQLEIAADANDELVGGLPRRTLNLILTGPAPFERRVEELRSYAGCFVEQGPDGVLLIPDRPVASSGTLTHAAGQIRRFGKITKRPQSKKPTLIRVRWTDPSVTPWNVNAIAEFPAGGGAERLSEIPATGICDYSEALRFAAERYNRLTLSDLSFPLDTYADATAYRVGDVIDVTLPVGITAKKMQVFAHAMPDAGLGSLSLAEYDPLIFSDAVGSGPSYADTSLASPNDPQPPTGLTLTEEVFAQAGDAYASRIKATWTAPATFPWVKNYRINVIAGGTVIWSGTAEAGALLYRSGALTEGVTYQVDVYTASATGALSTPASDTLLAQAAGLIPGDVPSVTGFEAGGTVRLAWTPAVDIDIRRYEVRYVSVGGLWSAGTALDRVDGLRMTTQSVPAGTWDFHVRALDSRGNYSANSAVIQIEVTFDDGAFLLDDVELTTVALTNAVELTRHRGGSVKRYVSTDGVPWNTKFSAAFNTYDGTPLLGHFNTLASEIKLPSASAGYDFGQSLAGNWVGEIDATALSGSVTETLGLDNGGGFTDYTAQVAKTTARYARVKAACSAGSACHVRVPTARVRLSAVGRKFKGTSTSLASGVQTIDLTAELGEIAAFNGPVKITPRGTSAASYSIDNYVTGSNPSFDPYLFDASGTRIATDFDYEGEVVP